jgi:hypothetical protein
MEKGYASRTSAKIGASLLVLLSANSLRSWKLGKYLSENCVRKQNLKIDQMNPIEETFS